MTGSASIVLLVGTTKGAFIFTSDPDRQVWQRHGPLFAGWQVHDLVRLPDSGRLLAATAHLAYGATVRVSDDNGWTWRQQAASPRYEPSSGRSVRAIWRFAVDEAAVFAPDSGAVDASTAYPGTVYAGVGDAGLFASKDAGGSWTEVTGLSAHPTRQSWQPAASGGTSLHSIVADQRRMWVAVSRAGVFRSDDGGRSWTERSAGLPAPAEPPASPDMSSPAAAGRCPHKLVIHRRHEGSPHLLYLQSHEGVFRSADGADSWERIDHGLPSGFGFPIAVDHTGTVWVAPLADEDERYMPGGRLAVYRSTDAGHSWQECRRGMPDEPHYVGVLRDAIATDACDPVGVYVGTTSGEIYASADAGESWRQLPGRITRITSIRAVAGPV